VYLTLQRCELQDAARHFAMDEVLPIATTLEPQRADIQRSLLRPCCAARAGPPARRCRSSAATVIRTEYAVERYWRDARLTTIIESTSEIQRKIISTT
jgi:alkylation response protein AidB-like acyl-CoA dehydrogenase